jgi:uncharacterized membrane protein YkoI
MTMTRLVFTIAACLAITAGALVPNAAFASTHDRHDGRDDNRGRDHGRDRQDDDRGSSRRVMSLDEAMAQAEKRYRARAVHGEEQHKGDRVVYRIRLLDKDGRVFEVSVDAGSSREK